MPCDELLPSSSRIARRATADTLRDMTLAADRAGTSRVAARVRFFYFSYFITVGIYYPFLVPHLRAIGLSGSQIGTAQMAGSIAAIPASFLWGALADRLQAPARALRLATRFALLAAVGLIFARTPLTVALLLLLRGLAEPAIIPLSDTVAVNAVHAEPGASYARVRLFGSLGFVVSAQCAGFLLAGFSDADAARVMPVAYAATFLVTAVVAELLPADRLALGPKPHLREVRALAADGRLILLLAACAVHAASLATYPLYGALVHDRGFSPAVTGAGMAFGVVAEVIVLFAFPALERRFSIATLLACTFGATALRWWLVSHELPAAWLVAVQVFHGLSFGLYWACAVKALSQWVPAHLRATGQAMFSSIASSLGGAIGYRLAGFGYEQLGGAGPVYAWTAVVELLALGLALLLRGGERRGALVLKGDTG
jgi:PPP family 3-phenylpropionic acid transporter